MAQSRVSGLDETTNKYPTITIAIVGHGEDLMNETVSEDPNIRIFSRAGQPFCLGIVTPNVLRFVERLYTSDERDENKKTKSSYQMLRDVAKHYNNSENDREFKELCDELLIEKPTDTKLKHTKKNIECKKHNQIYTPIYDHRYFFTDNSTLFDGQNGIHVLETINHISKNNINFYQYPLNLALEIFFIKNPEIRVRRKFMEWNIQDFLKNFNLSPDLETNLSPADKEALEQLRYLYPPQEVALNQKYKDELEEKTNTLLKKSNLKRYSNAILEKYPFTNPLRLIRELSSEDSEIHEIFSPDDDNIMKSKAKELDVRTRNVMIQEKKKAIEEKDEERAKQIEQKLEELRKQKEEFLKSDVDGIIENIKLSEIIAFLKSEGFVVINIIDFTCRTVHKYLDEAYLDLDESKLEEEEKEKKIKKDKKQENIRIYEEEQLMGFQEVKQNIGGRKNRKTRRKKSKKSRKGRKTRRNRK